MTSRGGHSLKKFKNKKPSVIFEMGENSERELSPTSYAPSPIIHTGGLIDSNDYKPNILPNDHVKQNLRGTVKVPKLNLNNRLIPEKNLIRMTSKRYSTPNRTGRRGKTLQIRENSQPRPSELEYSQKTKELLSAIRFV